MPLLQRNLDILHRLAPPLAAAIAAAEVPHGFEPVSGADGTPTVRRIALSPDGKKRLQWLGGTSMPRASAEPLIASLDPTGGGGGDGGQNGLGLSIGTGYEWAAFAHKLHPAQALYVYEPSPAALRMALDLCDLSALLAARRLALLTGPAEPAAQTLVRWLTENPGMEPPTVLHPLPTAGGNNAEARNALLAAGEAIVRQAVLHRQEQLSNATARLLQAAQGLATSDVSPSPASPARVLALLLTERFPGERPLHRAAAANRWETLSIDRPDTASVLLRMERLAQSLEAARADGVTAGVRIASDCFRGRLACVPATVPVQTWVPPMADAAYWRAVPEPRELAPADRVVVHGEDHRERLMARGFVDASIQFVPLGPSSCPPGERPPASPLALKHRLALVGDVPRLDAAELGLDLPTQVAVFAAAKELIARDYLTVHRGMLADLLRRSLAMAGLTGQQAEDPTLREPLARLLRDVLLPAVPLVTLAETLADAGVALTLIGRWPAWEEGAEGKMRRQGVRLVPFDAPPEERWAEVAALAHLSPMGTVTPFLWEAVAWGVPLISPEVAGEAMQGSLGTLLTPGEHYICARPAQFIQALRRVLGDGTLRQKVAAAAAGRLMAAASR